MTENLEPITLPEWLINLAGLNETQPDQSKVQREYAECDMNDDKEDTQVNEPKHMHITVFDPILGQTFELCDDLPGVWAYSVDGVPRGMDIELGQVPVYGLFMPLGLPHVVQRLPRSY